jgi:predicted GNAT superfamily acetyltransferase
LNAAISIKQLSTIEELQKVQILEQDIWQMEPIPLHQTLTAIKNGGVMLGAFEGSKLIGYNYGFSGFDEGRSYLCSHMMGISKSYQKKGLGKALKLKQREVAIRLGYSSICWTYDPLESINAYLNLSKLHGIGEAYIENCYGELNDSLNQGLPSDRFRVHWYIRSKHVKAEGTEAILPEQLSSVPKNRILLSYHMNSQDLPELNDYSSIEPIKQKILSKHQDQQELMGFWLPIPDNFQILKRIDHSLALDWRLKTREIIQLMIKEGYVAATLKKTNQGVHYYLFVPKKALNL